MGKLFLQEVKGRHRGKAAGQGVGKTEGGDETIKLIN